MAFIQRKILKLCMRINNKYKLQNNSVFPKTKYKNSFSYQLFHLNSTPNLKLQTNFHILEV